MRKLFIITRRATGKAIIRDQPSQKPPLNSPAMATCLKSCMEQEDPGNRSSDDWAKDNEAPRTKVSEFWQEILDQTKIRLETSQFCRH